MNNIDEVYRLRQLMKAYTKGTASRKEAEYLFNYLNEKGWDLMLQQIIEDDFESAERAEDRIQIRQMLLKKRIEAFRTTAPVTPSLWRRTRKFAMPGALIMAVVAVSILIVTFYFPLVTRLEVTAGETKKVILPDSSIVWLRGPATLSYNSSYAKNERRIQLQGEAFFDVRRDTAKPFVTETEAFEVTVLGTSYLVSATEMDQQVLVVSGKVSVTGKDSVSLERNQRARDLKGEWITTNVTSPEAFIGWQSGTINFFHTPLPEVAEALSAHYKIKISLDKNLSKCNWTASLNGKELREVLRILEVTLGVTWVQSGQSYVLVGEGC